MAKGAHAQLPPSPALVKVHAHTCTRPHIYSLAHSLTYSLSHSPIHSLTPLLPHPFPPHFPPHHPRHGVRGRRCGPISTSPISSRATPVAPLPLPAQILPPPGGSC